MASFRSPEHEDPVQDVILIGVFVLAFGTFVALAFVLIPPLRCLLYAGICFLKGVEALAVFEGERGRAFLEAALYYLTHPSAASSVPLEEFFRAVWRSQASPVRVGVVGAALCVGVWFALRWRLRRVPSERRLLKSIRNTPPERVLAEEFGVREKIDATDPRRAAETFARVRERVNVPPAVAARGIRDRRVRLALLYYRTFLEKGKVLWPVSDPARLRKIRERELREREKAEEQNPS